MHSGSSPNHGGRAPHAPVARALLAYSLKREIDAAVPGPKDRHAVVDGAHVRGRSCGLIRFRWADPGGRAVRPGARVRLDLDGHPPAPARVECADEETVTLGVDAWLGQTIPDGFVVEDSRWLLRSLRDRLLASLSGRSDGVALTILGVAPPRTRQAPCDWDGDDELNGDQENAVSGTLPPGVCLIHGPPGTGKTVTLAAAVVHAVSAGKAVLLTAPTNQAIDRLLAVLCDRLDRRGELREGSVIRLGSVMDEGVKKRWGEVVDPWRLALESVADPADLGAVREEANRLISSCQVLVTTVARTHVLDLRRHFDMVILDEASMTPLPAVYHVSTHVARHGGTFVAAGDPQQLPAVSRSDDAFWRGIYTADPFRLAQTGPSWDSCGGVRSARLRTQYRSDPPIAALANSLAYGELPLRSAPEILSRPPLVTRSLLLVDSSGVRRRRRKVRRYGNSLHADLIARVVEWLRDRDRVGTSDIVVLSRYRDQVQTIRRRLAGVGGVRVDTVHGLQGGEADTVIVDLSAAPEHRRVGDYLQDERPDSEGARILNVAVTRARRRLVVVADVAFLMAHPEIPPGARSRRLLKFVLENGERVPLRELDAPSPEAPDEASHA